MLLFFIHIGCSSILALLSIYLIFPLADVSRYSAGISRDPPRTTGSRVTVRFETISLFNERHESADEKMEVKGGIKEI